MFFLSLVHFLWRYFVTFGAPAPAGAGVGAIALNFAFFTVFAAHHSILARTRAKEWASRVVGPEFERTLYVWIASLLFVGLAALWRPVAGVLWSLHGWPAWLAWTGQIAGVGMTAWSAGTLGALELAGVRRPAKASADVALREDGPYGIVRHPIYLSWLLLVWSVPLMSGTRLSFAAISTLYLVVAVPFEERSLVALFGPSYTRYQSRVRARMIPYVY